MSKPLFALVCPFLFLDKNLTVLDQWQQSSHVAVVEVESLIHFRPSYKKPRYNSYRAMPLWKLKVVDMLTAKKPNTQIIYTAYPPLSSLNEKDRVILAFADFVTSDKIKPKNVAYASLKLLKERTGKTIIYGHPYHKQWPLVKNNTGDYYIPDCVDGLTIQPLINPLLSKIKKLSQRKINQKPSTSIVVGLWPVEKSNLKVCRCKNRKYNNPVLAPN